MRHPQASGSGFRGAPLRAVAAAGATAVMVLGVAGCGGGKSDDDPAGKTTPASKWTAEQQDVIDAYAAFTGVSDDVARGSKLDMDQVHGVAKEPFATEYFKKIDGAASAGLRLKGDGAQAFPRKVQVDGDAATYELCSDGSSMKMMNVLSDPPQPVQVDAAVNLLEIDLVRAGSDWLVTGRKANGTCTPGGDK